MKKNKNINKNTVLVCTWGLPGSGKTTFTKSFQIGYRSKIYSFSYDEQPTYRGEKEKKNTFINQVNDYLNSSNVDKVIVDSLMLTNEDFVNFIKLVNLTKVKNVEIQYWIPDVDVCLWNDKYRRSTNSEITIKNAKVEEPNIELIKTTCPSLKDIEITIVKNNVMRKENWKMFADKHGLYHDNGIVKSDTWSLGGTVGNCWNDHQSRVSSEPQPTSFFQFDDLLESVCPNINFLQYKKLYNNCVTTNTSGEGDYYGGYVEYAYFQYDIRNLYNQLIDMGFITN
jgi:hypothetical protein